MNVERYQQKIIKKYTKIIDEAKGTFEEIFDANFSHNKYPIVEYSEDGKIIKISYQEMKRRIVAFSYYLTNKIDNRRDLYIAINLENSPEWIMAFWGILMSGNKPYLMNLRHPDTLIKRSLKDLGVEYSVDLHEENKFGVKSLLIPEFLGEIPSDYKYEFANEIALSTSATSMEEKICFYSGKELLSQMTNIKEILKQTKEVRRTYHQTIKLLAFLPFYHIFGLITVYFWFTFFGYTIVLLKDYSPQTILSTIKKHEVTHLFAVPLLWHTIEDELVNQVKARGPEVEKKFYDGIEKSIRVQSKHPIIGPKIIKGPFKEIRSSLFGDSIQFCISGGSYLRSSSLKLMNAIGYPLYCGYGATEIGITSVELSKNIKDRLRNSVGYPLASIEYRIVDNVLEVKGESNCHKVMINGVTIKTDEYYITNDIVHQDETGRYYIDGRKSDIVIADNGENINPDVVEELFNFSNFPVNCFSILGLSKEQEKETLSIVIELKQTALKQDEEAIRSYFESINSTLDMTQRIKNIYFTFDQIKNPAAIKVSRKYLKAHLDSGDIKLFTSITNSNEEYKKTSLTDTLIKIFAEALRMDEDKIKPDSHFLYDLNGTSLDYFTLLSMINEQFSLEIAFDVNNPLVSVSDFEKYIMENKK